jgi:hypothetical protein
MYIL